MNRTDLMDIQENLNILLSEDSSEESKETTSSTSPKSAHSEEHQQTYACLHNCVEWTMRLEIAGRSVTVPCTKSALSFTDNLTDDALLNMDTIDKQMIQE